MSEHAGIRVRFWRQQKLMSQKVLAARAEIEHTRLCRIEKGKLTAHADELERIAAVLEMTMPEFYGAIAETQSAAAEAKS